MKKIYSLVAVLAVTFAANAQTNLITNGSLEDWTDANTQATGWFMTGANITSGAVSKQTDGAQDGTNYVSITTPASGNTNVSLQDLVVTPGETYTIKYWYKNDAGAKFKHWIQWRDASDTNISGFTGTNIQPDDYNAVASAWTQITLTTVVPSNAVEMRIAFRNYSAGATSSVDNVIVTMGTASVQENNIEGLKVYPNPASGLVNIVSNENGTKEISIFNMLGKKVLETSTQETINVSNLNSGIYIMNITQDGKKSSSKLVIK